MPTRAIDRKSTRLNSIHLVISYAVFCLKKKKKQKTTQLDKSHTDMNRRVHTLASRVRATHSVTLVCVVDFLLLRSFFFFFFFNDTATTEIYTLSLHDALPI